MLENIHDLISLLYVCFVIRNTETDHLPIKSAINSQESLFDFVVWTIDTFDNDLQINNDFTKYLEESFW